ncbi:MAG: hypothetical protein HC908_08565 [Calothrix sp. SM1_7_51]|nr:hypothetical protein [Calothrix sp. SM1_7_51]
MHNKFYPPPSVEPFYRLHIDDGLMINAERWKQAHEYHRLRQNIHYQSLNQPGIVCGLGVRVITAPQKTEARFRDRRWLEIKPGIAVNLYGNLIIFDEAVPFRLDTPEPTSGTLTVYLVVSYDESKKTELKDNSQYIREWFRIEEQTSLPNPEQIELCRVQFQAGVVVELQAPSDVFSPSFNQIDLRFRQQAQIRPQACVSVVTPDIGNRDDNNNADENISYLLQSLPSLYPSLQGRSGRVNLDNLEELICYDLLHLSDKKADNLQSVTVKNLKDFLKVGGVIIIEVTENDKATDLRNKIMSSFEISNWQIWEDIQQSNPLRTQPFLFGRPPESSIYQASGLIFVEGNLSYRWGLRDNYHLSRNEIRTAQELGINILNFAFQRKQMMNLLK